MVSKVRNVRLGVFSGGGCHHPNTIVGVIITGAAVCGGGVHSCLFKDWELISTNQISIATNQFVLFMSRFLK